jgi:hypothetical protein
MWLFGSVSSFRTVRRFLIKCLVRDIMWALLIEFQVLDAVILLRLRRRSVWFFNSRPKFWESSELEIADRNSQAQDIGSV